MPPPEPLRALGLGLMAAGLLLRAWAMRALGAEYADYARRTTRLLPFLF